MQEHSLLPPDAFLEVVLSEDKMQAWLRWVQVPEQPAFTETQLQAWLSSHGVEYGIHQAVLADFAINPASYYDKETVIASGKDPVQGQHGAIHHLFELDTEHKKPLELKDGKVDYKEIISLNNVRQGQLIATRDPAKPGMPGMTVSGEPVNPEPVAEARLKPGKNVVLDGKKVALYATIDGMVTRTGDDKLNVFPIFEVNGDVDYSIGNIDFVGSVVIRGNVLNGFKIRASGDIRITGGIEAAELEAGGSVVIGAGIVGQNKGAIRAAKSVKCSFVQEGVIHAGEDVIVMQSIMHSTVRAGRNVICRHMKGLIVGGNVQAGERVIARVIGNTVSTATLIEVGVQPELRNELMAVRNQLQAASENLQKTDQVLEMLDQLAVSGNLASDKVALRVKLHHTKKQLQDEIGLKKLRVLEMEKVQEEIDKARIEAASTMYAGTKLVIGRNVKLIKNTVHRVYFQLAEGDIAMYPLTGR